MTTILYHFCRHALSDSAPASFLWICRIDCILGHVCMAPTPTLIVRDVPRVCVVSNVHCFGMILCSSAVCSGIAFEPYECIHVNGVDLVV